MKFYQLEPLFSLAKKKIRSLIFCVLITVMIVVPYALLIPNQFQATAHIMPRNISSAPVNNLAGLANSIGGIASLTEMNFSNNTSSTNYALATANSTRFLSGFIEKYQLKKKLLPDAWNEEEQKWQFEEPFTEEAAIVFRELINFSDTQEYGTIEVSLIWMSREGAKNILVEFLKEINYSVTAIEKSNLKQQIDSLASEIQAESRVPIRTALLNLLQLNIEKLSSLKTSPEAYAFEVLDPPTLPLKRYAPNRTKIVLGSVSAVILMFFAFIFFSYLRNVDREELKEGPRRI